MAYKPKNKEVVITSENKQEPVLPRYIVVNTIKGHINGKSISAERGEAIRLTIEQYKVFQDKVLLIPDEE